MWRLRSKSNDYSSLVFFMRLSFEVSKKIGGPFGGGTTLLTTSAMFFMSHSGDSSGSSSASIVVLKQLPGRLYTY